MGSSLNVLGMVAHLGPIGKAILILLLALSVASVAIMLQKGLMFRKARRNNEQFMETFWTAQSLSRVFERAKRYEFSPNASLFSNAYREFGRAERLRYTSPQDALVHIERVLRKGIFRETGLLERYLPLLGTIGSVSPFIGLFGTVWGIMNAFHAIGLKGTADLTTVAPGIAEALINTAAGLFVAIPSVIAYNLFVRRARALVSDMEGFALDFLNLYQRQLLTLKPQETP